MKFDRRQFLTMGGVLGAGYVFQDAFKITQKIAEGVISNAHAQQLGTKRVFSLYANGAAPRWMFDLCLYPDGDGVIPTANRIEGVGTGFDNTGKTIFNQQKKGDYFFPSLWFFPVPKSDGTWESPENVLNSMLTIRGIWNATDGHQIANRTAFKPLGANASVHGMVADAVASHYPIPALVTNNSLIGRDFTSLKGINPLIAGSPANAMNIIRDSFKQQVSLFRGNALDALVTDALNKMDSHSEFKKSSSNFNRKKAEELIRANLATLVTDFNTKLAKYTNLIARATKFDSNDAHTIVPGIFDVPLTNYTSIQWNPDVPNDINRYFQSGADLRDLFLSPIEMNDVAQAFAMAEVLFENNLNANLVASFGGCNTISPLVLRKDTNVAFANNRVGWGFDNGHSMGLSVQTLLWSVYFRGFLTCLNEFISFLKTKNMFDDTLISLSSDFSRSPFSGNNISSRSDHGWRANVVSMWSGEIKTPTITGNTMLDATSVEGANFKNAWGVGRKSTMLNNYIGVGNANSTMASMIGVQSNTTNNKTLVKRESGLIVPYELPKTS